MILWVCAATTDLAIRFNALWCQLLLLLFPWAWNFNNTAQLYNEDLVTWESAVLQSLRIEKRTSIYKTRTVLLQFLFLIWVLKCTQTSQASTGCVLHSFALLLFVCVCVCVRVCVCACMCGKLPALSMTDDRFFKMSIIHWMAPFHVPVCVYLYVRCGVCACTCGVCVRMWYVCLCVYVFIRLT